MSMYRGKVTAVDGTGVYVQTAEYGVLGPCQAVAANYAVGDMVLCVDVGDDASPDLVVIGGLTVDGSAMLPATSIDNTVARFDSTSGRVQGSGVTIDDIGNMSLSGSIRASKPDATALAAVSTGNEAFLNVGGTNVWVKFRTAAEVDRFAIFAIGDQLRVRRFDGSGGYLNDSVKIDRATGRWTFGDVGATAGLEFGSSGPTITSGTGAPSHSAPNASLYLRTDGGSGTTLYVRESGSWVAK